MVEKLIKIINKINHHYNCAQNLKYARNNQIILTIIVLFYVNYVIGINVLMY